jgi:hypothetical protein
MAGKREGPGTPTSTNRVHFACFACRKCKRPMARMGRYFKAPRRNAVKAWQEVERLYGSGECFD